MGSRANDVPRDRAHGYSPDKSGVAGQDQSELHRHSEMSKASRNINIGGGGERIGMVDTSSEDVGDQNSEGVRVFRDEGGQGFKKKTSDGTVRKSYYGERGNFLREKEEE